MDTIINFLQTNSQYIGLFLLMLSSFLIGYYGAWFLTRNQKKKLISRLKKQVNELRMQQQANNIETIFTEIKPKIVEVVKQTQRENLVKKSNREVTEAAKNTFVNYGNEDNEKPELDFDRFGYADRNDSDDLTLISGIGPYIENKLNEIGIYNFDQISKLKPKDIEAITILIDFFPGRIERDDWVGQAEDLRVY